MSARTSLLLLALVVAAVTTPAARADWMLDFESTPRPDFVMTGLSATGAPSATFRGAVESGVLRMSDSRLPGAGGAVTAFGVVATDMYSDVRVTGTVNPAGGSVNDLVVLARAHVPTVSSYAAGINFTTGQTYILKFAGGREVDNALSTDPDQGSQPPLPVDRSYYLQFDVIGNQLNLQVFDASGGEVRSRIAYSDTGVGGPRFLSGASGVAGQVVGDTLLNGTFDNVGSMVIPEPAGFAILGLALGPWSLRRRGRG